MDETMLESVAETWVPRTAAVQSMDAGPGASEDVEVGILHHFKGMKRIFPDRPCRRCHGERKTLLNGIFLAKQRLRCAY